MDLKTALAPLLGITTSVAKVPLAGPLLARGAALLTTLPVHGSRAYDVLVVIPTS